MSLSQILKNECPICHKVAVEASTITFGTDRIITLQCGHVISSTALSSNKQRITNLKGTEELFPYQYDGLRFMEESDARCLVADEQGLGKTIEATALIKTHPELLPAVIVVPSSVKLQWHHQILDWCGVNGYLTQVISSGKELAVPGFQIYIITYDLLKNDDTFKLVKDKIKLVILDEVQKIKNHLSDRAKAVQRLCKTVEHVISLSGTPIENNAGEYFTVLNLCNPRRFPHYQRYLDEFCDYYWNGYGNKVGGLKNKDFFHEATKDIIIRRRKSEVLKDLPPFSRRFFHVELQSKYNKAYAQMLKELDDVLYADNLSSMERGSATIAIMSKMRHITGLSKRDACVEFVTEFYLSCNRKIVIFTHHNDVMDLLEGQLNAYLEPINEPKVLKFNSSLNADERTSLCAKFKDSNHRIMIASTQAAGIGLNLQFCSDSVMLERQWNPSKEKQAEDRFHRIGTKNPVTMTYMIASGTIDEYFTELVESKRVIVSQALDNMDVDWNESNLMTELATILVTKGREKWRLNL